MYLFWLLFIVSSCRSDVDKSASGEYIMRHHDEYSMLSPAPSPATQTPYPWQKEGVTKGITKEYFRCKGYSLNPPNIVMKDGKEVERFYDCSGADKHSLPLRDGKEFVYPILIELLNHVQNSTKKPLIVTSGHRCMAHQAFMDPSPKASCSKHLIGAEVDFYVQGLEDQPQKVVQLIIDFYKAQPKEFATFQRFDKSTDVTIAPWLNKEVFVKIYKSTEGRNYDNRHTNPYITIQVRFDREKNEKVLFSPELAQKLLRK
jgi:hypothetical protein